MQTASRTIRGMAQRAMQTVALTLFWALAAAWPPPTANAQSQVCAATGLESVGPGKLYYAANETVIISGDGFVPSCALTVVVTRPDGSTQTDGAASDAAGGFNYSYLVGGVEGAYTLAIASVDGTPLLSVSFDVGPVVLLDKGDYRDGETVHMSGLAFPPYSTFSAYVTRPDGSVVTGNGTNTPGTDSVTTDAAGSFAYDYVIRDGTREVYEVDVVRDGISLANTSFTDSTAFVQRIGTTTKNTLSASLSVTVGTPVGAGNSIIVAVSLDAAPGTPSCSDSSGNTYHTDVVGTRVFICSAHNIAPLSVGAFITASHANANLSTMLATEFSGLMSTPLDKTTASPEPPPTNSMSPTSGVTATTAQADELLFGVVGFNGNSQGPNPLTFSPGSGACTGVPTVSYTSLTPAPTFPRGFIENGGRNLAAEYAVTTSTGTYAACGTLSRSQQWSAVIATYKTVVDTIAPTTTITLSPATPNGTNNWYTVSVGVTVSAVDNPGGSSVAETRCQLDGTAPATFNDLPPGSCSIGTVTAEGTHVVYAASKDNAGNKEAVQSKSVRIDKTAPTTTIALIPASPNGGAGWYTVDVDVTVSAVDGSDGAGVAETRCQLDGTAPATFNDLPPGVCTIGTVISEGMHVVYAASNDGAGNTESPVRSKSLKIDKTAPTTTITLSPATPNGTNDWYTADVGVTVSAVDSGSGVAERRCQLDGTAPATFNELPSGSCSIGTVTAEGTHVVYATSKDNAGNTEAPVKSTSFKIDKTAPTLTWAGGINDSDSFVFGSVPPAPTCTAQDALSGPKSCVVTDYSDLVGSHTVIATALDQAGNQTVETRHYTVLAWTLLGFYSPVNNLPYMNTVKGGSTIPLKFEVFAGSTELTSTAIIVQPLKSVKVSCDGGAPLDEIELLATGGTVLRYDTLGGQFIYNWQTPKQPGMCYTVTVETLDGSKLIANFKLK